MAKKSNNLIPLSFTSGSPNRPTGARIPVFPKGELFLCVCPNSGVEVPKNHKFIAAWDLVQNLS